MAQQFPLGSLTSSNPLPSCDLVCGGHLRVSPAMTSLRGWRSPVPGIPTASFMAGGPILPRPGATSPRSRPRQAFSRGVQLLCSRRPSAGLVRDGFLPRMAFPRGGRSSRPRSRRHGNIFEQEIKQAQKCTTAAVTRASPDGVLGGVGGHPPLTTSCQQCPSSKTGHSGPCRHPLAAHGRHSHPAGCSGFGPSNRLSGKTLKIQTDPGIGR